MDEQSFCLRKNVSNLVIEEIGDENP